MRRLTAVVGFFILVLAAFLAGRYSGISRRDNTSHGKRILYYVDPMHPAYHSDKPGIAPDCGMALEPVYEGEDPAAKLQLPPGAVSIATDKQQLIGVRVETVVKNSGSRLIRTTGRVEADDNRVHRLMAATDGYVLKLENNPAGTIVKKDELLATFYSKEFRNAQQAYLGSLVSGERIRRSKESDELNQPSDVNLRLNEEQLRALGMGDPQIKELAKNRLTDRNIRVVSPVAGVVLSRSISPDFRFEKGAEFYRIADLSKVWIIADIFGGELPGLRQGARVRVTVRELGKTLYATVSENPPLFDSASRTLKLRLEADNPGFLLRPDMFVDLEFHSKAPAGLSVPQEAVLDSGLHKIVYVETSEGVFEPRPVEIGTAYDGRITITRGLADADRVVTSGNFLIDSESRLRSAALVSSAVPHDEKAQSSQNSQETVAMRDPVCGMPLDHAKAHSHVEKYHGETYVFCSDKCQKKFQQDPEKYIGEKPGSNALPQHEIEARR